MSRRPLPARRPARAPAPSIRLTIRFREKERHEVIARYCIDVMKGGMLIRTARDPLLTLGSRIGLRFLLAGGEEILAGVGLVAWLQRRPDHLGVGVQFEELTPAGDRLYRDMLARREQDNGRWLAPEDRRLEMERFDGPTTPVGTPLPFLV